MIAGLDSSFSRPTPAIVVQARAAGVRLWSGYLATKGGVNLASPWDLASFDIARQVGGTPIAFCSGLDDPVACRNQAAQWNVRLCLDVEAGIRPDGSWVQQWLDLSGAGLYGQHYQDTNGVWHSIHLDRKAAFHVMSWYIGRDPGANWTGPQPADGTPLGWQWQGGHTEFGLDVDRGTYADWFAGTFALEDKDKMLILNVTGSPAIYLLSGSLVVGFPEPDSVQGLIAAGVKQATITPQFLDVLLKASTPPPASGGTVDLTPITSRQDALGKHLGVGIP